MIGQGKGPGTPAVDRIETELLLDPQPSLVAELSIWVDRSPHLGYSVFGEDDHPNPPFFEKVDEIAGDLIDGPERRLDSGIIRPEALKVIIQMGQIDER